MGKTTAVLLQRSVCRAVSVREEECETMLEGFAKLREETTAAEGKYVEIGTRNPVYDPISNTMNGFDF